MQIHVCLLILIIGRYAYAVLTFVDDHREAGKEVEEAVNCREVE